MPVLDGLGTLRKIGERSEWDSVKVVAISASVLEQEHQEFLAAGFGAFIPKPFRSAEICACLARLLGVEYEYAQPAQGRAVPLELEGISLSPELLQHLKNAAELSSVTELEKYLDEMEGLGGSASWLAAHLCALSQDFRMDEVLAILDRIEEQG